MTNFYQDYDTTDGAGYCPECLDVRMRWNDSPVWATDQVTVYEIICPACGHIEHFNDVGPLDDDDYEHIIWFMHLHRAWLLHPELDMYQVVRLAERESGTTATI